MLEKINRLKNWQASLFIAVVGFAVYFTGLSNPFMYDDLPQIVNNVPVHSISNVRLFFEGSTFYFGHGLTPLGGVYYRPLMTTVFSLLYTLFGPHPIAFHMFQLLLCIGSAIILYLLFRYLFKPLLSLFLALIFLVHPVDSQVVFAIPNMQDALFFFFGVLALYILVRFKSLKSLVAVAICLFLSLLSKETGILFVILGLLYLFWFDQKKRLYMFTGIMCLPITLYLVLKVHAVGFLGANPNNAPIDKLGIGSRLLTVPSMISFYITKLIFPLKLSSAYYWTYPTFSLNHFLVPLVIDLAALALVIYLALVIHRRASKAEFYTYLFFALWSAIGLLVSLQLIPLDMTASEAWFYFPMVGVLGMIGVVATTIMPSFHINRRMIIVVASILLIFLGFRTALRGTNWSSAYTLAKYNVAASSEDYVAYDQIAIHYYNITDYSKAIAYGKRSVAAYPNALNYNTLGQAYAMEKNFPAASASYNDGLKYQKYQLIYDNLAALTAVYGGVNENQRFLINAVHNFSQDPILWLYLAILQYREDDVSDAKVSIQHAYQYGPSIQAIRTIYHTIINGEPLDLRFAD